MLVNTYLYYEVFCGGAPLALFLKFAGSAVDFQVLLDL